MKFLTSIRFYLLALLFLTGAILSGCSFGKVVESVERTPVVTKSQGEGRYSYYVVIRGKDGKMHLYPVQIPYPDFRQPKPEIEKPKKEKRANPCQLFPSEGGN